MNRHRHIAIALTFLLCTIGCSDRAPDMRLSRVAAIVSESPKEALSLLDSINYSRLSTANQHYYDFLTIKATDKAFIRHPSDSLVLQIINYYDHHRSSGLYTEALYYGGRVYNDLGDYPTALNYYQNALDRLPSTTHNLQLRGQVLSQMGSLLNSLRLYERAIPYVEEVIRIDSIAKDSINLMYDTQLLGSIHLHARNYDTAEALFKSAKQLAEPISAADVAFQNVCLAAIKYHTGQIDSALTLIRPTLTQVDSISRDMTLGYACDIYRQANIPDTALIYAHELIHSKYPYNRINGYQVILSPDMVAYSPIDSVIRHIADYRTEAEAYLERNGKQEALLQNSFYNYQLHQRERIKAETKNQQLHVWIIVLLLTAFILTVSLLALKYHAKSQQLQLHKALSKLSTLRQELSNSIHTSQQPPTPTDTEELRQQLRYELLAIQKKSQQYAVAPTLLESGAYKQITEKLAQGKAIPETSPIWKELEASVAQCYPGFTRRLNLLMGGALKPSDLNIALLIKCQITPTQLAILLGRSKSTIAYRRDALSIMAFGKKIGTTAIDDIIHYL